MTSFSIKKRVRSFNHAFHGVGILLKTQHNAWIHLLATLIVTVAAAMLGLSEAEWALLVIAISLVWLAEALNTAIEFLADAVTTDFHPLLGKAKDVAAGGVLIAACGAVLIGTMIFGPRLVEFIL